MNIKKFSFIILSAHAFSYSSDNAFTNKKHIINFLKESFEHDQKLRKDALAIAHQSEQPLEEIMQKMNINEINKQHIAQLKEIISYHGWPTISEFGSEASDHAWILVQHALDIEFQKQCLILMQQLPCEEVSQKWIAYLYDRIQTNSGQLQRYGTQINGETRVPFPIEDPDHVDERRAVMGLESLQKYLNFVAQCENQAKKTS